MMSIRAMPRKNRQSSSLALHQGELFPRVDQGLYRIIHCDAFEWLESAVASSIQAVVTDPPYGLIEYSEEQLHKKRIGKGGVWRIPPSFDGCERAPLPRFTVLTGSHRSTSFAKAATFHEADCEGFATFWGGHHSGSLYGFGLYNRRGDRLRIEEHRPGAQRRILRHGCTGNPFSGPG